ncbi:DNA processing protein DprA [Acetobacter malorum DSM 14337]|uniref:DNA processing protein DprA n=1 Tax=Acetobacter malorum DSM 14337 TaxID=1307910 RepID=A0ABQ0PV56_9PROT|nr:DNA-processing protein DprA [Acetobacter malorum]KXV09714.1 DNA polymerase III [Acetobacter malorum]GBQ82350.1 DNA processing protein DprA [Acetobacter malorum DSM 14337]
MNTLVACLRLARTESVGPRTWRRLLSQYHTAEAALEALPRLPQRGRVPLVIPSQDSILREIEATLHMGGRILTLLDADYPFLLKEIPDAPPVLSVLGDVAALSKPGIGLIGARNASSSGLRLAESLATELVEAGVSVVSGLARGIDTAAHKGALHRQGLTVAAIAGGLDKPYPLQNAHLQAEIAEKGAVVTEAPLGTAPLNRHFPRRNRLIAGLTLGCVVVEAAPKSGSLITARLVGEYGRELFAVPGSPLDPRCRGSNDLLRNGAVLTETVADILPHLPPVVFPEPSRTTSSPSFFPPVPRLETVQDGPQTPQHSFSLSISDAPETEEKANTARATQRAYGKTTGNAQSGALPPLQPASSPSASSVSSTASVTTKPPPPLAETCETVREKVLDLLSFTPIAVDDLVRRCQFSASAVLTVLTELELSGCLDSLPGGRVVRAASHGKNG